MNDRQRRFSKFEARGEADVRAGLASGRIAGRNADYAREWLALRDFNTSTSAASEAAQDRQSQKMTAASMKWIAVWAIVATVIIGIAGLIVNLWMGR